MSPRFLALVIPLVALAVGTPTATRADGVGAPAQTTADALFWEAKQLEAQGRYPEACARFEQSLHLVHRLGVLLNVANCHEHVGRTASAWAHFGEAAELAVRTADPRATYARDRAAALAARVPRLVVTSAERGTDILRDGEALAEAARGVEIPVDPGEHTIAGSAPGRVGWSTTVRVTEGAVVRIEVPALPRRPEVPATITAAPARVAAPTGGRRSVAAWSAIGVAAVGAGAGTYLGLAARARWRSAEDECGDGLCAGAALDDTRAARTLGHLSTAAFTVAAAALTTGLVLHLTGPDRPHGARITLAPAGSARGMAVTLEAGF